MTVKKVQVLTWLVVLLLVLNVVTIASIIYHNYQERKASESLILPGPVAGNPLNGRFLRQELRFDRDQLDAFRQLNQSFRPWAMEITYQIDSLKGVMFDKMQETPPDSVTILALAKGIGDLHGQLKQETYRFYRGLYSICRDDQKAALEEVFRPLFINETTTLPYGPGNRRGPGWRGPNYRPADTGY